MNKNSSVVDEPKAPAIKSLKKRERPLTGRRPKVEQQIYVPPAKKNAGEKGWGWRVGGGGMGALSF